MASFKLDFRKQAIIDLDGLDKSITERIVEKLEWFALQSNPLLSAKRLKPPNIGKYRFRIGDYRVVFDLDGYTIVILTIGHRSTIYR